MSFCCLAKPYLIYKYVHRTLTRCVCNREHYNIHTEQGDFSKFIFVSDGLTFLCLDDLFNKPTRLIHSFLQSDGYLE